MSKRFKVWAYSAALLSGALLGGGCGFGFGGGNGFWSWSTILAILQEDLFS